MYEKQGATKQNQEWLKLANENSNPTPTIQEASGTEAYPVSISVLSCPLTGEAPPVTPAHENESRLISFHFQKSDQHPFITLLC